MPITGVIGRKLDNWPHLVVNLLFANGFASVSPVSKQYLLPKFGQFSSNLRPITQVIDIYLENKLTFTPREV